MSSYPEDDNAVQWRAWEESMVWWKYPPAPDWLLVAERTVRHAREFLAQLRAENASIPMSAADHVAIIEDACRMTQVAIDARYVESNAQRDLYRKLIERGEAP